MVVFHSFVGVIGCLFFSDVTACGVFVVEISFIELVCKGWVVADKGIDIEEQKGLVWPSLPHKVHSMLSPSYSIFCL